MATPTFRCLVSSTTAPWRTHHIKTYAKLQGGTTITYEDRSVWSVQGCSGIMPPGK